MSLNTQIPGHGGLRRIIAALGVFVAGTAMTLGSTVPASAAQNINPEATGSITIHKFEEPTTATGLPNNGTQQDTSGLKPIGGVTFTAQRVDTDLSDAQNWQGLEQYTVAQAQENLVAGSAQDKVTNTQGVAAFTGLPVGLYLVTETSVGENNIGLRGEPFLVTMPLALDNGWLYDVHVYPKNTVTEVTKEINDSSAFVIGDPISFTLNSHVPSLPAKSPLTAFGFTDTLDSRLDYVSADINIAGVQLQGGDYTVGATDNKFSLTFNESGLVKLRANQGAQISVVINTTINSLGNGRITNQASNFINDPQNSFESNTVSTEWGALQVLKYAAQDESLGLSGAEFELYALAANGERLGGALRTAPETGSSASFVSGDNGQFLVQGLKAGNYELVETKAPLGYKMDSTPIPVTITAGSVAQATNISVENTQVEPFELPFTGSTGALMFAIVGVLLLVGGGIGLSVLRKRKTS
ncbi:SpaH/EbpB family LPXTG-anchored major pilin [Glutamicibacter sp. MNS18]|uniref:SpaH/EbpB family LPXTG-anchored major pilin n=1 Tax=Glutamicibacter sp. MNS18 TaxID=2989817 RepID=UPI0022355EF0|nr:SpaH/EbpB family LPXTG-anchored major pilin [Glutamicibacter sp. MNS18]MCW4466132.1 SpaH/EbpB family LPXTG-anchored major pilin [Glutamicibacter sp. MNS18]